MTAKSDYPKRKCTLCYIAGIERFIRNYQVPGRHTKGLTATEADQMHRWRDHQLKLWGESAGQKPPITPATHAREHKR